MQLNIINKHNNTSSHENLLSIHICRNALQWFISFFSFIGFQHITPTSSMLNTSLFRKGIHRCRMLGLNCKHCNTVIQQSFRDDSLKSNPQIIVVSECFSLQALPYAQSLPWRKSPVGTSSVAAQYLYTVRRSLQRHSHQPFSFGPVPGLIKRIWCWTSIHPLLVLPWSCYSPPAEGSSQFRPQGQLFSGTWTLRKVWPWSRKCFRAIFQWGLVMMHRKTFQALHLRWASLSSSEESRKPSSWKQQGETFQRELLRLW